MAESKLRFSTLSEEDFNLRGRQNLRQLKKTGYSFNTDSTGARYVCKATDELTKNRATYVSRKSPRGWTGIERMD